MSTKKPLFHIKASNCERFIFGNCAVIAIACAFKKKYQYVKNLYDFIGVDSRNGVTTKEIKKMVDFLCKEKELENKYFSNKNSISVKTFLKTHKKGTFLLSFNYHLAYLKNGVFYDDFLRSEFLDDKSVCKLYGWWEIKKESFENTPIQNNTVCRSYLYWSYA